MKTKKEIQKLRDSVNPMFYRQNEEAELLNLMCSECCKFSNTFQLKEFTKLDFTVLKCKYTYYGKTKKNQLPYCYLLIDKYFEIGMVRKSLIEVNIKNGHDKGLKKMD